jgi:hypothetical protein
LRPQICKKKIVFLHHGISVSNKSFCWAQVEGILNGIVSMLALVTGDKRESLILSFCEKLSKAPNNQQGLVCLKVQELILFLSITNVYQAVSIPV